MIITKESQLSGKINSRDIDISLHEYENWIEGKDLIQDAFPNLSPDDREFLLTGATPEEWESLFPEDEDDFNEPF